MKGQRIGYVRVSSFDQNPERQLEQSQVDKVFTDKASGKDTRRPRLDTRHRAAGSSKPAAQDRPRGRPDDTRRLGQVRESAALRYFGSAGH